jgi:hypothetical protein
VQGDSDRTVGFGGSGTSGANRLIGDFHGQKGQRYKLDVYVLSDTSSLNVTNPRLDVGVEDPSLEGSLVLTGLLKVVCTVIAVIGGLMLIGSFLARRQTKRRTSGPHIEDV